MEDYAFYTFFFLTALTVTPAASGLVFVTSHALGAINGPTVSIIIG